MGRESLVLLKNEANLLPLQLSNLRNILVTGPLATDTTAYVSRYGPQNLQVIHVLQGVRDYVGQAATVHYAKGCEVVDATWPESEIIPTPLTEEERLEIQEAVEKARRSDVVIAVLGEDEHRVGESKSRTGLALPDASCNSCRLCTKPGNLLFWCLSMDSRLPLIGRIATYLLFLKPGSQIPSVGRR